MNCRRCNTPIPSRSSSCPNCGRATHAGESFIDDPGDSGSEGTAEHEALSPSTVVDDSFDRSVSDHPVEEEEEELSLEDAVASPARPTRAAPEKSPAAGSSPPPARKSTPSPALPHEVKPRQGPPAPSVAKARPGGAPAPSVAKARPGGAPPPSLPKPRPGPTSPASSAASKPAGGSASLPDPDVVRAILAEHPELLEPGLELLVDEGGRDIGVRHATDVGVIDLLATDAQGCLVAVIIADPASGSDLVGEALHRLGWVRKHLAKNGEGVRGIVVTDHLDTQLSYAAAAVSDKIRFKSYALSLSLTDLEF